MPRNDKALLVVVTGVGAFILAGGLAYQGHWAAAAIFLVVWVLFANSIARIRR